jgi:hypothetical protein
MGFGDFIQGIGKGLDEFGKNTRGPALEDAGKAVDDSDVRSSPPL